MTRLLLVVAIALGSVAGAARDARAYPQFQLSKDQTCTACHISPAGGGLLNENGLAVAQLMATFDSPPEAAHGALAGPSWLLLSGDFRGGAGVNDDRGLSPVGFPMQAELDGAVRSHGFTLYATVGAKKGDTRRPITFLQLREHYLMWQQNPDGNEGLYVRAGRFMPVFGLRLAEHNVFTRRYGQTPLYGETYGAAVEYVKPAWEVHATAFVHDPIQEPVERGDGVAFYGEARIGKAAAIGAEARYAKSPDDARLAGGMTGKYWLASANLLLQAELQLIGQTFTAGGNQRQLVSYLLGSWFLHTGWMLDVGVGQFDENLAVPKLDLEAIDVNLHWFTTSHWELLLTNRVQTIDLGAGGATSGYSLVQFHYRL